jgi:hypothetical protein
MTGNGSGNAGGGGRRGAAATAKRFSTFCYRKTFSFLHQARRVDPCWQADIDALDNSHHETELDLCFAMQHDAPVSSILLQG